MNSQLLEKNYKCPLCGFEFTHNQAQQVCLPCPFSKKCEIYCCPNCHYQFIHESKLVNLWHLFQSWRGKKHEHT